VGDYRRCGVGQGWIRSRKEYVIGQQGIRRSKCLIKQIKAYLLFVATSVFLGAYDLWRWNSLSLNTKRMTINALGGTINRQGNRKG
jgi:hypothetical protein